MSIYVDIEKKLGSFCLRAKFEAENETLALLGASGCGKSMTLKCIAGIEKPDHGKIILDGITLFDSEKHINFSPQERQIGLMFQNYALFPNMTVLQNIQTGAKREKNKKLREIAVQNALENFGLTEYMHHYPHQLSGGQQQRTALARILVSSPRILLLDEPFSALDSHLRFRLEQEVRHVIENFGKTVILVSHDRDEVYRMSDRIAIMDCGKIQAIGTQKEVFQDPQTSRGALLTGCKNISAVSILPQKDSVEQEITSSEKKMQVFAKDWGISLTIPTTKSKITSIGIRMHDIKSGSGENSFRCQVMEEIENPFSYTIMLKPLEKQILPSTKTEEQTSGEAQISSSLQAEMHALSPLGWELSKEEWLLIRAPEITIQLPPQALLLLQDD